MVKKILLIAALCILIGVIIAACAFAFCGWSLSALSNTVTETVVYEPDGDEDILSLEIFFENADINLTFGAEKLSVSYPILYDKQGEAVTEVGVTSEGGNLKLEEKKLKKFFINVYTPQEKVDISLPSDKAYALHLKTSNGDIELKGNGADVLVLRLSTSNGDIFTDKAGEILSDDVAIISSSNGDLRLGKISAQLLSAVTDNGDISYCGGVVSFKASFESDNGDIKISDNINAESFTLETNNGDIVLTGNVSADSFKAMSDNGDIQLSGGIISSNDVKLVTNLGDISAKLNGVITDYKIDVEKDLGDCNISDTTTGDKKLSVETDLGDIHITFDGN